MKPRTILTTLAVLFAGAAVCLAADVNMGTWKLNEAKSKLAAGATKNNTVIYEAAGDKVKITVDGVDADGKAVHHEWTGKYDGKDYPVTGDSNSDTRSYKKVASRTLSFTAKKAGKVTVNGRVVVAADGKSRTVTTSATDSKGKKVHSTAVYDKQ
jgi:phage gp45-like